MPDVIDVSPTIEAQALVTRNGMASGVYVRGVMPEAIAPRPADRAAYRQRQSERFRDNKIIIGIRMAERLSVTVGDTLTLISPVSKSTVFGAAPRMRGYQVAAIFDVGMYEYDNSFIFMPMPAAQVFFIMGDRAFRGWKLFVRIRSICEASARISSRLSAGPAIGFSTGRTIIPVSLRR